MDRAERLKSDPAFADEYRRQSRERMRRLYSDPEKYAAAKLRNNARAALKREPRPPLPSEKACTQCGEVKPATLDFYGPRRSGRYKLTSWCKACLAAYVRQRYTVDPGPHKAAASKSARTRWATDAQFRDKVKKASAASEAKRRKDPSYCERCLAQDREWYKLNRERAKTYKHRSGALRAAHTANRRAAKLRATPIWADPVKIKAVFEQARQQSKETGVKHHVDHFYPLAGKTVCGLHVHTNLRVITETANKRKSNRLVAEDI